MLKPLSQWFCDTCGEVIQNPNEGWLEWIEPVGGPASDFRICHHRPASPREEGCYVHTNERYRSDGHLHWWAGDKAKLFLLKFLNGGELHAPQDGPPRIKSIAELAELTRRLTFPHYEEARRYWGQAAEDGEFYVGTQSNTTSRNPSKS